MWSREWGFLAGSRVRALRSRKPTLKKSDDTLLVQTFFICYACGVGRVLA